MFERYACIARLGHNGVDRQPALGFLVAVFEHRLSRDADPQLHDHPVVANAVEAADGRRSALDGTMLYGWQRAADAVYQAALRAELSARLGLTWVQRNGVWEIDGIPPALFRLWSKRRAAIEAEMAELGMVHEYCQPDQCADAMIDHWLTLRDQPEHNDVRMLATENSVVERLNLAARAALIARGEVSRKGRTYSCDTREVRLSVGDRVRLGRNDGHLAQPDGTHVQVRNGMEGTITALTRHNIIVTLDPGEDLPEVTLPARYVAEHVTYAYAITANKPKA